MPQLSAEIKKLLVPSTLHYAPLVYLALTHMAHLVQIKWTGRPMPRLMAFPLSAGVSPMSNIVPNKWLLLNVLLLNGVNLSINWSENALFRRLLFSNGLLLWAARHLPNIVTYTGTVQWEGGRGSQLLNISFVPIPFHKLSHSGHLHLAGFPNFNFDQSEV